MRSPFPGVDPFIEDQGLWPDFHHTFITYWREAIAQQLPPGYSARINERFEVIERTSHPRAQRLPDVAIEHRSEAASAVQLASNPPAGALVLEPVSIPLLIEDEQRDSYIEIYRLPDRKLVTVMELLSPTNKTGGGYNSYLNKRNEILLTDASFVEIDLLMEGSRLRLDGELPAGDFFGFVSRASRRPLCDVYAWRMVDRIPAIPIPLLPEDADVWVDLQEVFSITFERGQFARELNYGQPLSIALPAETQRWVTSTAAQAKP